MMKVDNITPLRKPLLVRATTRATISPMSTFFAGSSTLWANLFIFLTSISARRTCCIIFPPKVCNRSGSIGTPLPAMRVKSCRSPAFALTMAKALLISGEIVADICQKTEDPVLESCPPYSSWLSSLLLHGFIDFINEDVDRDRLHQVVGSLG